MAEIRVLYIEDIADQREEMAGQLASRDFAVTVAESGESGVAVFQPGAFDLILCDLNMPGMDGLAVLKEIREHCPMTPFILLTAHATLAKAIEAVKLGAQDFVYKPVDLD
ncbi:MAG: response regulator, partial [candidate division Zixibacteria bacterium]|nr:response regulator [candidate division Zixibacteria bacterium]